MERNHSLTHGYDAFYQHTILGNLIKAANGQICAALQYAVNQLLQVSGENPIITVNESNILTLCGIKAHISCMGHTTVRDMNDPESGIFFFLFIADLSGTVSGAVVDEQTFKVVEGLGHDLLKQAGKVTLFVVNWDDYA